MTWRLSSVLQSLLKISFGSPVNDFREIFHPGTFTLKRLDALKFWSVLKHKVTMMSTPNFLKILRGHSPAYRDCEVSWFPQNAFFAVLSMFLRIKLVFEPVKTVPTSYNSVKNPEDGLRKGLLVVIILFTKKAPGNQDIYAWSVFCFFAKRGIKTVRKKIHILQCFTDKNHVLHPFFWE